MEDSLQSLKERLKCYSVVTSQVLFKQSGSYFDQLGFSS